VRVDRRVSATGAVEIPLFLCLRNSSYYVIEVGGKKVLLDFEGCHAP
jgi:hypothetical protein